MKDRRLKEIINMLSPAPGSQLWFGGASPLGCLRGVDSVQAAWKPERKRHSIWELFLHIAYWKYAVRRKLDDLPEGGFPRSPANWPGLPEIPDEKNWKSDRKMFREEQEKIIGSM